MRIQHNIMAMNAYRNYNNNTSALSKNLEKLSSGYKINRAGDDAAGLAISEKMRAQITGLKSASKNVKDGVSLVKTAEGALQEVHDMLNRMDSLATQSANGTYDNEVDRLNLQKEVTALKTEIDRIADSSNFNGLNLLDGSLSGGAKVDGKIGTTNVSFSLGTQTNQLDGAANSKVTLSADENTAAGTIDVAITDAGAITIKLGSADAASYTADQITQAVRDKAKAMVEDTKGGVTDDQKAIAKQLSGFTVKADGTINLAKGTTAANASTTELAFTKPGDGQGLTLQIGDTSASYNQMAVTVQNCHTAALGIADLSVADQAGATEAIAKVKTAINTVSSTRGDLGALQNRLEHTSNNLSVMTENIQDAESTIRDTDVADEMMAYTKNNILIQSAQAMLAQANQVPQGVLQLLQ